MLISEWKDEIYKALRHLYAESSIEDVLQLSPKSHDKIVYYLAQRVIDNQSIDKKGGQYLGKTTGTKLRGSIPSFILNFTIIFMTVLKYCLVPILFRLITRTSSLPIEKSDSMQFIFLNSAGGVDRFVDVIPKSFKNNTYRMYYIFTSQIKKIYQRVKKNRAPMFLAPEIPGIKALRVCIKFSFGNGNKFTSGLLCLFGYYPLPSRLKAVVAIINYLYASIIYHYWARKKANELSLAYPNALYIFDVDEASKELMLADSLNRLGKTTLLIQHGILTDPKRYMPTCFYIACPSEREGQALRSEGIEADRLFYVGQSLQTVKDSKYRLEKINAAYPILILAGDGPLWIQQLYVDMLINSEHLKRYPLYHMRLHPAFRSKQKKIWASLPNVEITSTQESLGQSILKSDLVIAFSIDALTVAVRQYRLTICCIPSKCYVPEWHEFLETIPLVTVAKTSAMLDEILDDDKYRNYKKDHFSDLELQSLDYAIGSLDTDRNLMNLFAFLSKEAQQNSAPGRISTLENKNSYIGGSPKIR
jgi:hypothetical protein